MKSTRLYWTCQVLGWGGFTLYALLGYIAAVGRARALTVDIISFVFFDWIACPLATHGLRAWMRRHRWLELPFPKLLPRLFGALLLIDSVLTGSVLLGIAGTRGGKIPPSDSAIGIFVGFFIALAGWTAIYFMATGQRRQQALQTQALELSVVARDAQLRALRAQLNPHFLFNSLNTVRGLIPEDPDRAMSMVTGFASLMRYSLGSDRRETVAFEEEMTAVDDYLELERVRFEDRLRVERAIAPDTLTARVPPMIVQLLVENAIKHGIAHQRDGGVVRIDAVNGDGRLRVRVANTGTLAPASDGGVGLDNARERLRLLFLDIQMPGATGFDLLHRLETVPLVIFTTAYDEYAVKAFEVNALDYLLKPIRPERLAQTLEKTRAAWQASKRQAAAAPAGALGRVFIRDGEKCWLIEPSEIALLEAEGNYTRVVFGTNRPLLARPLHSLEARLAGGPFFRASRSHIFNLKMVESVETEVDGSYIVVLRGGRRVPVSRRQSRRVRETLSL